MNNKCHHIIYDKITVKYRKCKKYSMFNNLCYIHLKTENYINKIIIIQKFYRGFHTRKILNNIYIKLPFELQSKIKYYLNENHYIDRRNNIIGNIIINKLYIFKTNYSNHFYLNNFINMRNYIINNITNIEHLYYLITKYIDILHLYIYDNYDLIYFFRRFSKLLIRNNYTTNNFILNFKY